MTTYGKNCLIVFAKEPQKGRVKTRLEACLSQSQCLNLYKAFLKDTIETARKVDCEEKIIAYDAQGKGPSYLKDIAAGFKFYKQRGRDLGERMHNAFKFAYKDRAAKIIIIGSDLPDLSADIIEKAFYRLDKSGVVLGPAFDGGYYLVGLKKPCRGIFIDVKWSSESALEDTLRNCRRLAKHVALLDAKCDVDDVEALFRLKNDLSKPKNKDMARWTRKFIRERIL